MELEDRDYQALLADQTKARDLEKRVPELEAEAAKVSELERKVEEAEAAKTKAETERDDFKTKVDEAAEESRKTTLAGERFESLGSGFKAKLGKFTKDRLQEQAKSLSDEEWEARLKEIEETAGVKRDEGGESGSKSGSGGEIFSREEAARAGGSGGGPAAGGNGGEPSESKRRSVVAGLRRKS